MMNQLECIRLSLARARAHTIPCMIDLAVSGAYKRARRHREAEWRRVLGAMPSPLPKPIRGLVKEPHLSLTLQSTGGANMA